MSTRTSGRDRDGGLGLGRYFRPGELEPIPEPPWWRAARPSSHSCDLGHRPASGPRAILAPSRRNAAELGWWGAVMRVLPSRSNEAVERMFARRGARTPYTPERTVRWLAWLARALSQHAQTIFYLENLQPTWLPTLGARRWYMLADRLGWGLIIGLLVGLAAVSVVGLLVGPAAGLAVGLLVGLAVGLASDRGGTSAEMAPSARGVGHRFASAAKALGVGMGLGQIVALASGLEPGVIGLAFGLPLTFAFTLTGGPDFRPRSVAVVESVRWSLSRAVQPGLVFGLAIGLAIGLIVELGAVLAVGQIFWKMVGMTDFWTAWSLITRDDGQIFGLVFGTIFGIVFGLISGIMVGGTAERAVPNHGIRLSCHEAIILGLVVSMIAGPGVVLATGLVFRLALEFPINVSDFGGNILQFWSNMQRITDDITNGIARILGPTFICLFG